MITEAKNAVLPARRGETEKTMKTIRLASDNAVNYILYSDYDHDIVLDHDVSDDEVTDLLKKVAAGENVIPTNAGELELTGEENYNDNRVLMEVSDNGTYYLSNFCKKFFWDDENA